MGKSDFHFRLDGDLRKRLATAAKEIKIKGDRRRKTDEPALADLVTAGVELLLARHEAGEPIVTAPSLVAKSARQAIPRGKGGGFYLAPLNTAKLYLSLAEDPRPDSLAETALFDLDARHIEADSEARLRGLVFTQNAEIEGKVGEKCKVRSVSRKRAQVTFGRARTPITVHVFDLEPMPGKPVSS